MKKVFVFMIAFALLISQVACAKPNSGIDETSSKQPPKPIYSVQIELNCDENLLFSRYDIDVFIDDDKVGTLDHGSTLIYQLALEEGTHALTVTKENEKDVDGTVQFTASDDMKLSYKLACTHDQVEIEEVSEAETTSKDIVPEEPIPESGVNLEEVFPVEYAKRTVVVAMTNALATDVFKADGNTYDLTLFHSYSDTSDYYITIFSDGDWSEKDENTWHVDDIKLKIEGIDTYLKGSMDVSFDGINYIVSHVSIVIAALEYLDSDDPSKINVEEMEPSESTPFLTVNYDLIKDNRVMEPTDESASGEVTVEDMHTQWVDGQFDFWDGSHIALEDLIVSNLNDEKSYKHIQTTYVDITDENIQASINETLKTSGYSQRVEIGDLFIMTEFSAKNAYNATIKSIAIGIARYSDNSIELVSMG